MKKIESNIVSENIVMDDEAKQSYVSENMLIVPKNQVKKFLAMSLDSQIAKINFYKDMIKLRTEAKIKNSVVNKTKELFEKRHASVEDANKVIEFCKEYIDGFRLRQIAELDAEIARLEEKKRSL